MARERDLEKAFNQRLDDVLARKVAGSEPGFDSDTRSALEFAGKLGALCVKPSPEFKTRLKSSLLQRQARLDMEKANRRGWLLRLVPQAPVLRLATALAVIALVTTAVWASGVFNTKTGITTPASPLSVAASTNKTSYTPGEPVLINVSLTNTTEDTLKIEQYPPILSLLDSADKQAVYTFHAGSGTAILPPHQTATFTLTWNQQNDRGVPVGGGHYYIELEDLTYLGHDIKLTPAQPASFDILPGTAQPQAASDGTGVTTIELNVTRSEPVPGGLSFGPARRYIEEL